MYLHHAQEILIGTRFSASPVFPEAGSEFQGPPAQCVGLPSSSSVASPKRATFCTCWLIFALSTTDIDKFPSRRSGNLFAGASLTESLHLLPGVYLFFERSKCDMYFCACTLLRSRPTSDSRFRRVLAERGAGADDCLAKQCSTSIRSRLFSRALHSWQEIDKLRLSEIFSTLSVFGK